MNGLGKYMIPGLVVFLHDEFNVRLVSTILSFSAAMFISLGIGMEWAESWI